MALTKDQKNQVVADTVSLLQSSKMTVITKYPGTSVKAMQQLRAKAKESGTSVRVIKNRLFKKALESIDSLKGVDSSNITGQLIYAFNSEDEVLPAQNIAEFARFNPHISFVGAISAKGNFLSAEEVAILASLPTKDQLRAQLIATIAAPNSSFVNVLAGNIRGVMNVLSARAETI